MFLVLRDGFRLFTMARVLSRHDALLPAEAMDQLPAGAKIVRGVFKLLGRDRSQGLRPGQRLAAALSALGPSHIKLGQFLATRSDILGAEVAGDLSSLQDDVAPFSMESARAAVAEAFGAPVEALFTRFDPPIAAASIAQVHPAEMLLPDGGTQRVAVKILRPEIEAEFARDLSAFALAARLAARFGGDEARRLRPLEIIQLLKRSVALELDLRFEAAAASEMAENTLRDGDFRVPRIVWERTAPRVLTSEWVEGIKLSDKPALLAAGRDLPAIARQVVQHFLRHALRDGFFHADMHPGNLFIDETGKLTAVDFGIMGRLDLRMRRFMADTLHGFLTRDYRRIAQVHFDVGFVPPHHAIEDFAQALRSVGEAVFGRPSEQISMARLLAQLFEITRLFDMKAQPQLVLLQKTMVVVEGVARDLDPHFNMWETARPVIEQWMTDRLGPEQRLRDAAEGVTAFGRVVANLPKAAQNLEALAEMTTEGGFRLHPETTKALAEAEAQANLPVRAAIWIGAAALAVIALAQI
ncbi:MAG: 2-polyprenylphenol 6-hydroxylase [Alphaproteobacteria bacterium]|nr:2-polyprenylphenol 6-hydroxylase [Alphaproteobacteria bacterium]